MNDVAILIDCWETEYTRQGKSHSTDYILFSNIKSFIEASPSIKTIILASYQSQDPRTSIWWQNYKQLVDEETFRCKDLTLDVSPFILWTTAETILNWKTDCHQITLHTLEELALLIGNSVVDNVYLCGQSLEECLRLRPLGWESLAWVIKELKLSTQILIKDTCVNDEDGNTFNLEKFPEWEATDVPGIFRYIIK
jgi:hypothetical protein